MTKSNIFPTLIYTLIFVSGGVFAQKSKDSLSKYSYLELDDLIFLSEEEPVKNSIYLNYYFQKATHEQSNKQLALYYKNYVFLQKEENRLAVIDSALKYAYKTHDKALIGNVYLTKGTIFHTTKDYENTLDNYLTAYDYISQTDDTYNKYRIKNHVGVIKNYLGYYDDAESLFKECIAYFGKDEKSYNMQRGYVSSLEGLAWTYTKTNRIQESNEVLQTALTSIQNADFSELDGHYIVFKQGINDYFSAHYDDAIYKIEEKLPFLHENEDFAWATIGDFYIGKSYWDKNEHEKAIVYFEKINDVFNNQNYTHPDLREGYELLINYYKNKNDKDQQLYYVEQLVKADSVYNLNYKHLISQIHKKYEIKDLLLAKQELETALYFQKYRVIIISAIAIFLLGIGSVAYFVQQKKAKKTAQELIKAMKEVQNQKEVIAKTIAPRKPTQQVSDETVRMILKNLNAFEEKQFFLRRNISLASMAKDFKTNTAYLSSIINQYKNSAFTDYINNLRIQYIITEMINTDYETLINISLDVYAEKAGYTNLTTFSRAFQKQTKVSPAIFLKELRYEKEPKSA